MFETDSIPTGWDKRINFMDSVWVPTQFSKDVFIRSNIIHSKIRIIGEPVDTTFYSKQNIESILTMTHASNELKELYSHYNQGTFMYLFVGKWEFRKGITILIESFCREFKSHENVVLAILTSSYHSSDDFHSEIKKIINRLSDNNNNNNKAGDNRVKSDNTESDHNLDINNLPKIILLNNIPQVLMPMLYSVVNILVQPSYGEGWGRPHVEAMSVGIPIIATNWSGPTEYLNEYNGYPLRYDRLVDSVDWKSHKWAQPSIEHLRYLMRYAKDNKHEVEVKGRQARNDMIHKYSIDKFSQVLRDEVLNIYSNFVSYEL